MFLYCLHFSLIKAFLVGVTESLFCLSLHITLTHAAFILNQTTSKLRDLKINIYYFLWLCGSGLLIWVAPADLCWSGSCTCRSIGCAVSHCKGVGTGRKGFVAIFSVCASRQYEQARVNLLENEAGEDMRHLAVQSTNCHQMNEAMLDRPAVQSVHRFMAK